MPCRVIWINVFHFVGDGDATSREWNVDRVLLLNAEEWQRYEG